MRTFVYYLLLYLLLSYSKISFTFKCFINHEIIYISIYWYSIYTHLLLIFLKGNCLNLNKKDTKFALDEVKYSYFHNNKKNKTKN